MSVTRAIVLASTLAAALVEVYLATTPVYEPVFWISLSVAAALFLIGRRAHTVALPIVMMAMYLMPAVFLQWVGRDVLGLEIIWIFPIIGLVMSGRDAWSWSLPTAWQWPLVAWALIVSISWPIVFLREVDFSPAILPLDRVYNSSNGIPPLAAGLNITYFALGHTVGILWLDALFRWFRQERFAIFSSRILFPLAGAIAISCVVSVYQGFVDLRYLNSGFWAYMERAAGTLGDPNKFGMIAALWAGGVIVLSRKLAKPWSLAWLVTGLTLLTAGVWTSGTRTGLAALAITLTIAAVEALMFWRSQPQASSSLSAGRIVAAGVGALVVATALVLALRGASTATVADRGFLDRLPFIGNVSLGTTLNDWLWERDGYGPSAIVMIREHPVSGVGVGSFHTLVHDFGKLLNYDISPDNAQNWIRHLLAELGIVGSIPWISWCLLFAVLLFMTPTLTGGDRLAAGVLRGTLAGFAVASLFGMAGQSMPVIITFWTFVFWFVVAKDFAAEPTPAVSWSRRTTVFTVALVLLHAGVTMADARGDLLPRNRAMRFDIPYSHGLGDIDRDPNGGPGRRWTIKEAVAVIPVKGKVLKFVAWIDHPDGDERPVPVRIWADSKLVYSGDLKRSAAIRLDIPATPGTTHMVIETWIERLWRPTDYGRADRRELGLSIRDWEWED